jgi:hypothetical protein
VREDGHQELYKKASIWLFTRYFLPNQSFRTLLLFPGVTMPPGYKSIQKAALEIPDGN